MPIQLGEVMTGALPCLTLLYPKLLRCDYSRLMKCRFNELNPQAHPNTPTYVLLDELLSQHLRYRFPRRRIQILIHALPLLGEALQTWV